MLFCYQVGFAQSDTSVVRQWGVSIDPTSMFNYVGNISESSPELPTWQGLGKDQFAIEYLKFTDSVTFNRFQLGLSIQMSNSSIKVQQLNAVGDTLEGLFASDEYQSTRTNVSFRYSKERLVGDGRLKGHIGYFTGFGISKISHSYLPQNSLENHIGDTLLNDSGRIFQFKTGVLVGVNYSFTDNLMLSSTIDFGLNFHDQRNAAIRQVVYDPVLSNDPFIQNITGLNKNSAWNIDINYHPNLVLTFLF